MIYCCNLSQFHIIQKLAILPKTPAALPHCFVPIFENLNCFEIATTNSTNLLQRIAVIICLNLDYFMTTNKVTISSNRKLLEILGISRLADNETDNCDVGDSTFTTLLNNIAECKYFDIPNSKILSSTDNGITFLHINLRSINNQENFDKFNEFLTFLPSLPDIVCVSKTRLKGVAIIDTWLEYNL